MSETKIICWNIASVMDHMMLNTWKLISMVISMSCAELKVLPHDSESALSKYARLYPTSPAKSFIAVSRRVYEELYNN